MYVGGRCAGVALTPQYPTAHIEIIFIVLKIICKKHTMEMCAITKNSNPVRFDIVGIHYMSCERN